MSGTAQLSKARESRLLKIQMTNSASRGEISAKRATKQAMGVTLSPQRRRAVRIERGCPLPATCHLAINAGLGRHGYRLLCLLVLACRASYLSTALPASPRALLRTCVGWRLTFLYDPLWRGGSDPASTGSGVRVSGRLLPQPHGAEEACSGTGEATARIASHDATATMIHCRFS
jgi:hypothetical protein